MTDCAGRTVTFTGESSDSSASKVDNSNYLFGTSGLSTTTSIADAVEDAINLARANGDLAITVYSLLNALYLYQLVTPQTFNQGSWKDITATSPHFATPVSFGLSNLAEQDGYWTPRSWSSPFPSDDIYLKPHVVVAPDFTLHHYDLDHVDANFNITSTTDDNPRQAPFSKRFQLTRTPDGDKTTLG
jgi:hypothetical protein